MTKKTLPVEGKAIRFAPSHDTEPAARFWKVWAEGNEVYASARTPQGLMKISVHASGQIHYRLGPKLKQDLAPLMKLAGGFWMHAFELRFLLSEGANAPLKERESLKNKSAYLIPVSKGFVFYANLIVGIPGAPVNCPLPPEFAGGQTLWLTQLRDGRPVILVARMMPLDVQNRNNIKYIREELKPTVTFSDKPTEPYIEIFHVHWSPQGGNVVLVVPMGDEAVRSEQEAALTAGPSSEPRIFRYQSLGSAVDVVAPNGLRVAVLELGSVDRQIELSKNSPSTYGLGMLKMQLEPGNLIAGSKFMASPCRLGSAPTIGGGSPHNWAYTLFPRFDGFELSVEIQQNSASLRNANLVAAIPQLDNKEEILMTIPYENSKLVSTLDAPTTAMEMLGRFILRDSR